MPLPFANQTAVITGAGSGIGAAVALGLAERGAFCVLAGRRVGPLEAVAAQIVAAGGAAEALAADVREPAQVERLVARAMELRGRVDILVNAAGIFQMAPFESTSLELFDATLAVNLRGAFLCCQAVWPAMRLAGGGQIVNLSSVAGVRGFEGNAAYSASKFGLNGLSAVQALEGRPHNIRVLAVCPAAADTAVWEGQAPAKVRERMMPAAAVAGVIIDLLAAPSALSFEPVLIGNFQSPWQPG
jgi:NAD(P)-dependent dehydrogenase (short-subunit alcohol dehydrogenase family)